MQIHLPPMEGPSIKEGMNDWDVSGATRDLGQTKPVQAVEVKYVINFF